MALDLRRRPLEGDGLDHVGIKRSLGQVPGPSGLLGLLLKKVNELVADDLPLLFRVHDAGQLTQKKVAGVHHPQVQAQVEAEKLFHFSRFILAQQAVVHKNAGQLASHRSVQENRHHR